MVLPKRLRTSGRWIAGGAAVCFGCLAYVYLTLPDVRSLRTTNPTTTAFMELRAREARAKGQKPKHVQQWVSYRRISPNLTRAVLVAEDAAFWQHEGLDVEQLEESLEANWATLSFVRGGSTITQQLAKNLYLSPSKNPLRKFKELIIARRLEAELQKSRILELYLNVIEWGDGIYGADAAARAYFRAGVGSLGPAQSAMLAGAIINPRVLNPARPNGRLIRRQGIIMRRMGSITPPPAVEAVPAPVAEPGAPASEAPVDETPTVEEFIAEPVAPEEPVVDPATAPAEPTEAQ